MAMIVLVGETSIEDVNLLKSTLSSLKKSSYFYLGYMETGKNDKQFRALFSHTKIIGNIKLPVD